MRILLADDQPLLRTGFRMVLGGEPDLDIVAEAGDGVEAVDLARRLLPDVVLMDIRMPRMDGVAATRIIVEAKLPVRVLILTTSCTGTATGRCGPGRAGSSPRTCRPTTW